MKRVLNLVLTHQSAALINRTLAWWHHHVPSAEILLAVTEPAKVDLSAIDHPHIVTVDDDRLRTRDHQREFQSYTPVFVAAARWLENQSFDYVHFAEYDHLPLLADFNTRQLDQIEAEKADVLGFEVLRVDDTNQAHYVYHARDPAFHAFWESMSCRQDRRTVLSMFGSGSFWSCAAFQAVAGHPEPLRTYLELWLPTVAHHLGYRVRSFKGVEATGFVTSDPRKNLYPAARARGAWTVHPVKILPAAF